MRHLTRTSIARQLLAAFALTSWIACATDDETSGETPSDESSSEAATASPEAEPGSFPEVVARVNDTEISKAVLLERADAIRQRIPPGEDASSVEFYGKVLDDLVSAELLYQASVANDLAADDQMVEAQLDGVRSRFPDENTFIGALQQEGLSIEELKADISRDLSIQRYVETQVSANVSVTPEQAQAFYEEQKDEMREPDSLRLSHVLKSVGPDASPEDKAAIRAGLEEVLAEARGGADFAALAKEHSEDPGSAAQGGELTVRRGETVPPFEQAAFALDVGDVSDVVETQFGFHIIKLSEKIEGRQVPFDEAKPRIEAFLRQQAMQEAVASAVESLEQSGDVERFLSDL